MWVFKDQEAYSHVQPNPQVWCPNHQPVFFTRHTARTLSARLVDSRFQDFSTWVVEKCGKICLKKPGGFNGKTWKKIMENPTKMEIQSWENHPNEDVQTVQLIAEG